MSGAAKTAGPPMLGAAKVSTGAGTAVARPAGPPMTGARRAAIVLLALGEKSCATIMEHFDENEVKELSMAMAELGTVRPDVIAGVVQEFLERLSERDRIVGDYDRTEEFLRSVLPGEKAEAIIDDIRGRATRNIWRKMSTIDPIQLTTYLQGEYPQTAALILSRLPAGVAARALSGFGTDVATDILNRMLTLNNVQRDALDGVERVLHAEFLSGLTRTARRDSHAVIADIFNSFDRQTEKRLMETLEVSNEDAASRIKQMMFTFDDLVKLGPSGIQTLLRGVDRALLAQSLKGASDKIREMFTENMSTRAAKMLLDDISSLPPMKMRDVESAQGSLVQYAKDLEAKGELSLGRSEDDELV